MPETKCTYQITSYKEELHILQKPELLKVTTSELVEMCSLTIKTVYFSMEILIFFKLSTLFKFEWILNLFIFFHII